MWNWQDPQWPQFEYSLPEKTDMWEEFQKNFNVFVGACFHLDTGQKESLYIDILSYEALETSRIEGEFFSHESLHSSLQKNFGLKTDVNTSTPKEQGIAQCFHYSYKKFSQKLSSEMLCEWNSLLLYGKKNRVVDYRKTPVYIVSSGGLTPKVHFEGVFP